MGKLQVNFNKTLKLINVLKWQVELTNSDIEMDIELERMKSFINANGGKQIGPLIRYLNANIVRGGEDVNFEVVFMLQSSMFIEKNHEKYEMEPLVRVPNCMYCRYIGPEDKLNFAYDKINLEAFENDIPLKGDSYTIFVDRNEEEETITADVFMERASA